MGKNDGTKVDKIIPKVLLRIAKENIGIFVRLAIDYKKQINIGYSLDDIRSELENIGQKDTLRLVQKYSLEELKTFFEPQNEHLWGIGLEPQISNYKTYENQFDGTTYPFKKEQDAENGLYLVLFVVNDALRLHRHDMEAYNAHIENDQHTRQYISAQSEYKKRINERKKELTSDLGAIDKAKKVLIKYGIDTGLLDSVADDLQLFCDTDFRSKQSKVDTLCAIEFKKVKPYQFIKLLEINKDEVIKDILFWTDKSLNESTIEYSKPKLKSAIAIIVNFNQNKTHPQDNRKKQ